MCVGEGFLREAFLGSVGGRDRGYERMVVRGRWVLERGVDDCVESKRLELGEEKIERF